VRVVEKRDGKVEREILTGMVTHPVVLSSVAAKWDDKEGMFNSPWANVVAGWCVKFYEKYGKAPGKAVEGLYEAWSRRADEDTARIVEKFLAALSGEYVRRKKEINPEYLIDRAGQHFTQVRLSRLRDAIDGDITAGDLEDALKRVNSFDRLEMGQGATIDLLQDFDSWKEALADPDAEILVRYPGALGKFYGDALARDNFVAFLGPEKRGKTWALMDVAWRAMLQRRKVLFFEIGDLSKRQVMRRFGVKASGIPIRPGEFQFPVKLGSDSKSAVVKHKTRKFKEGLSFDKAVEALKRVALEQVKSKKPYFKLEVYPNNTIGMTGIRSSVQRLERSGWVPDVVVIDYADLLAAPPGYTESRDQINASWKAMRALSQEYHCLVLTATQANAASYKADSLDMSNFSEDKRKFAHVTGMVGLNQSDEEKEDNILRYNWLVLRESRFSMRKFVFVAGCPELASPCILSSF
jgi:hypothetical protein